MIKKKLKEKNRNRGQLFSRLLISNRDFWGSRREELTNQSGIINVSETMKGK